MPRRPVSVYICGYLVFLSHDWLDESNFDLMSTIVAVRTLIIGQKRPTHLKKGLPSKSTAFPISEDISV